ncbi:MAG: T9SS type A sorting domain-containing protein, partial [Bacteroidales bacterium]|nr:T9SS type A sorting domain-containing protein [Bacteroidales bacterium]
ICTNELADERTYKVAQHKNASYTWSIKGGTIISGGDTNEVVVQWISVPPYELKVIETDGFLTDSSIVQIGFKLAPNVDAISNRDICENDTVLLTVTGNAASYTWDYDAGTGDSVYVHPDSSVTYTVTGIDTNGCSNQDQVIVTIHKAPNVVTTSNRQMCVGQFITLTASGDALTYVWENGAGTGTTVMVDPKRDTMFVVRGSDVIGCSNTDTVMVKVDPRPDVDASGDVTMCAGLSTDLVVTGTATSYSWNNLAGTGTLVSVSPDTTTKYTVIGTDDNGCQSADTVIVEIMDRPTVVASENDTVCWGDTVTLTATGNALTYNWSDGSVGNVVQVVPLTDRTYTVTGIGSNGCETNDDVTLTLKEVPSVNITSSPDVCMGESVSLHVTGNALSYEWSHGGGNDTVITITPVHDTTYRVTGTGENGCWNIDEATINVHPLPVVTASSADTICMEQSVVLYVTGTAETYEWDNDAGFGEDVSVSPESNTLYTVTGTDIYGCKNTDQVFVNVKPIPSVEISAIDTICGGDTIWLSVSGDALSYTWDKGLGSNTMVEVSPHQTTTYSATGIYSNGCTNTEVVTVEVIPAPIIIAGADHVICRGESTILNVNGTALEYTWSDGLGSGLDIEITPDQTNKYTVTGVGEFGCINSDDIVITVNSLPEVGVQDAVVDVCKGKGTLLKATGNAFSYVWSDNLGVGKSIAIEPTEDYTYSVTGIALNNCRNTAEVSVFLRDYPDTPMVYQIEHLIHTNVNEGIQWYEGEYEIADATTKFYAPEHDGTFKVEVTNQYGCSTQSEYYEFEWTWVHVDEHSMITDVQMYPNPVQGLLTIDLGDEVPLVRVRITDLSGKEVVSGDYFNSREIKIDTYGLKSGLYIIEISDKTSKLTSKFIKQ